MLFDSNKFLSGKGEHSAYSYISDFFYCFTDCQTAGTKCSALSDCSALTYLQGEEPFAIQPKCWGQQTENH